MKIFINVLSDQLLDACKTDLISNKIKENVWGSSSFVWEPNLLKNIDGPCMMTPITDKSIVKRLEDELSVVFEKYTYNSLSFQYYIWDSHSAISIHNDYKYLFGATIYLNNVEESDGGFYMWKGEAEQQSEINMWKCIVPDENMIVINDQKQDHMVTPVSPHAKDFRCTIQIFAT